MRKYIKLFFLYIFFILSLASCEDTKSQNNSTYHRKHTSDLNLYKLGVNDRLKKVRPVPKRLKYPDDCVNDVIYKGADIFQTGEDIAIGMSGVKVTDKEVNEFGDEAIKQLKKSKNYKFIYDERLKQLKLLLKKMLSKRGEHTGIKYQIHLIDNKVVNAFTVGGHIVITTGILNETKSQSAIAYVLGHEIGHNEKGHLRKTIKKLKLANRYIKGSGNIALALQSLITPAFNQPNEIEADYYGAILCYKSGFDPRKGIDFWKRMSKKENETIIGSYMRTHPYSSSRAECLKQFLKKNLRFD